MYKTIVVGTDGSATADRAVSAAARLALDSDSEIHIVTAFSSRSSGIAEASGAALVDSGRVFEKEAATAVANRAANQHSQAISCRTHVIADSPADAILDAASSVGADLIVVGSKGMRGARRVLGSVPNSVAHGASCDVLVVKTD
jgi:nucleotide-binding universal stress UspA family protein